MLFILQHNPSAESTNFMAENQVAKALACNPVYHIRTKHMEIDIHFVRNLVSENKIEVPYIPTEAQSASILTKALPAERF